MIIDVPPHILEEVANVTASAAKMGVKVHWMDETLCKNCKQEEALELFEEI